MQAAAVLMFHVKQYIMAIKTTIGIILFILSMSLFITAYKICNDEDKEMNPYYLFISLILSIGVGSLAFVFIEA